jgi:hypothetical protein
MPLKGVGRAAYDGEERAGEEEKDSGEAVRDSYSWTLSRTREPRGTPGREVPGSGPPGVEWNLGEDRGVWKVEG